MPQKKQPEKLMWFRIGVIWFLAPSREVALQACRLAMPLVNYRAASDGGIVVVGVGRGRQPRRGVLWLLADEEDYLRVPAMPTWPVAAEG